MKKEIQLVLPPNIAFNEQLLKQDIGESLGLKESDTFFIKPLKRSIDARSRNIKINLKVEVIINEPIIDEVLVMDYKDVSSSKHTITIIGAGPACTSLPRSNTTGFIPNSKQRNAAYKPAGPAPIIVMVCLDDDTSL